MLIGVTALILGVKFANDVPEQGDARREALGSAVTTGGATLLAVALALISVLLTLHLQERLQSDREWADVQVSTLSDALRWAEAKTDGMSQMRRLQTTFFNKPTSEEQTVAYEAAVAFAQEYYENEGLSEAARLRSVLDSAEVTDALQQIDDRLRMWNERGAPVDLHTGEVHLVHWMTHGAGDDELGDPLATFAFIDEQRIRIAKAYVGALREAHRQPSPEGQPRSA